MDTVSLLLKIYHTSKMPGIILASQSPQRKIILKTLEVDFKVVPARVDEQQIKTRNLAKRAELIARLKAETVQSHHQDKIIIAADTFTATGNQVFEKPNSPVQAKQMLKDQSGKIAQALTGFCYLDRENQIDFSTTINTKFQFRKLSNNEIDQYVTHEPVTTWSAAFCPGYPSGAALVAWIEGSLTSFTHGLPIELVAQMLAKSGVKF